MPTLFFLPWREAQEPIDLGEVRLVPFERGMQPGSLGGATQSMIDAVLAI